MKITIEIKKNTELTKNEMELMYHSKKKEYGEQNIRNFKEGYPNSIFFFVKDEKKIVAFGALRNLTLKFEGKDHKILGICNILTIKRRMEYGRILIASIINYIKKSGKTGLGFCVSQRTMFYKTTGLKVKKNLIPQVVYKNPAGKLEPENRADGVYYEGKDKFVTKLISSKSIAYTSLKDW